jgi:hydrogenase maturation protease
LEKPANIIVLSMGNDIIGDDGVGFVVSRGLRMEFENRVDFEELSSGGLDLLDVLEGYKKALIIDSISTGKNIPGTILEYSEKDCQNVLTSSPHSAGLPEVLMVAKYLSIPFPEEIRILAIEIEKQYELHEGLTPAIEKVVPSVKDKAKNLLYEWLKNGNA